MTEYSFFSGKLVINPLAVFFVALICLIDKTKIAPYFVFAAFFHELGHIVAIIITNGKINRIKFGFFSVTIEKPSVYSGLKNDFFVSMAGILANSLILIISYTVYYFTGIEQILYFSAANAFIGGYNLLPLKFLDGGEMIHDICLFIRKEKNNGLIENIFHILTVVLGIIAGSVLVFNGDSFFSLLCFYPAVLSPINRVTCAQKAGKAFE